MPRPRARPQSRAGTSPRCTNGRGSYAVVESACFADAVVDHPFIRANNIVSQCGSGVVSRLDAVSHRVFGGRHEPIASIRCVIEIPIIRCESIWQLRIQFAHCDCGQTGARKQQRRLACSRRAGAKPSTPSQQICASEYSFLPTPKLRLRRRCS